MSRSDPQIKLRVSAELKAELEAKAKSNGRSLNAELVDRLEESVSLDKWHGADNGYSFTLTVLEEAIREAEEARDKLEREYGLDQFDAMKDEILAAIRDMKN